MHLVGFIVRNFVTQFHNFLPCQKAKRSWTVLKGTRKRAIVTYWPGDKRKLKHSSQDDTESKVVTVRAINACRSGCIAPLILKLGVSAGDWSASCLDRFPHREMGLKYWLNRIPGRTHRHSGMIAGPIISSSLSNTEPISLGCPAVPTTLYCLPR